MAGGALLVLGNRKGDVVAFNAALGDIAWRAQRCHTGCVQRQSIRSYTFQLLLHAQGKGWCETDDELPKSILTIPMRASH
jgi:hypothetical protein